MWRLSVDGGRGPEKRSFWKAGGDRWISQKELSRKDFTQQNKGGGGLLLMNEE